MNISSKFLLLFSILYIFSCSSSDTSTALKDSKKLGDNSITVHELGDPDRINPLLSATASSTYIESNIFQSLLGRDPVSYELYPLLVKEVRPKML